MKKAIAEKYKVNLFNTPAEANENAQRQKLDDLTHNLVYLGCEQLEDSPEYIQQWNVFE